MEHQKPCLLVSRRQLFVLLIGLHVYQASPEQQVLTGDRYRALAILDCCLLMLYRTQFTRQQVSVFALTAPDVVVLKAALATLLREDVQPLEGFPTIGAQMLAEW